MRNWLAGLSLSVIFVVALKAEGPPSDHRIQKKEQKYAKEREKLYKRDQKAAEKMARRSAKFHEHRDKKGAEPGSAGRYPPQ